MTFLRNCWYVAGFADEATDVPFSRTFLDEQVVIFRGASGTAVALSNHCPHRFAPMDRGRVVGDAIQCAYHGLAFGADGGCAAAPNGAKVPPHGRLTAYSLVERHQILWIWMGDAAMADPGLIPDFAFLDHDRCGWFNAHIPVNGSYLLIIDNLLDLSHGEFLHPMLSSPGWMERNEQTVCQDDRSVTIRNVALNDPMLPLLQRIRPDMNPVGTWVQDVRWEAPGAMTLNFEYESDGKSLLLPNGHFVTPETAYSCHYMIRGGHYDQKDDQAYTAQYKAGVIAIFTNEDVPMIEAQQRYLGSDDLMDRRPAVLEHDNAALRARRLLAKKIREEQAGEPQTVAAE